MFWPCCAKEECGELIEPISVPFHADGERSEEPAAAPAVKEDAIESESKDFIKSMTDAKDIAGGIFTATLCRESTRSSWGFYVDLSDAARVHICRLNEGPAAADDATSEYNKGVEEQEHIRVYDYVVALNGNRLGTESDAKNFSEANLLIAGLNSMLRAVITLQRPRIFDAEVVRNGEPLGLDINFYGRGASFGITAVLEEGIARKSTPQLEVGDRIIAVNGSKGDPDYLQEILCEASGTVTLTVSRRLL